MTLNDTKLQFYDILFQNLSNLDCQRRHVNDTINSEAGHTKSQCGPIFDGVMCWPPTLSGHTASMSCPKNFGGFEYNSKVNATRRCGSDGEWADKRSNYRSCLDESHEVLNLLGVFTSGYTLSILCLCTALFIFTHFKSLKCTRNYIHCHLISAFILRSVSFLVLFLVIHPSQSMILHQVLTMLFILAHLAIFHWMLVEGLYLFKIIYCTYGLRKLTTRHFAIIGWGIPVLETLCNIIKNLIMNPHETWIKQFDYFTDIPIIVILIMNACLMLFIIHALVVKLRARRPLGIKKARKRNDIQSQESGGFNKNHRMSYQLSRFPIEYRKAMKATLVLMPLLGLYYIIFITHYHPKVKFLFTYLNAVLSSTQGFLVSLIYCFLNIEVRKLVRGRLILCLETTDSGLVSSLSRVSLRLFCCVYRSPVTSSQNGQRVRSVYQCQGQCKSAAQKTNCQRAVNFEATKLSVAIKPEYS